MSAEADTNPPTETPKKEKKEPYIRTDFPLSFFVHRSKVLGHVLLSIMSFTALVLIGISMGVPWMRKDQYNNEITDTATGAVTSTGLWYRKNLYAYKLTMNAATLPRNNENKLFDFRFGFSDFCYRVETRLKALFSFLIVSIALSFVTFILSIVNAAMGGGVRTAWHTDDHIEEEEAFIRRNPRHTSTASELNQLGDNNNNNNNNEPQEEEEEEAQQHPVKTKRCNHAYNVHIATTIFGCFAFSALTITISFAWNLFLYSFLYPECLAEADNLKTSAVESHLSSLSGTPLTTASALIQVPQQVFDNSYHSQFYEVYVGLGFAMTAWALMGAGVLLSHYHFSFELDPLRLLSRLLSIYYTTTMISFLFVVVSCPIPHFFYKNSDAKNVNNILIWNEKLYHGMSWSSGMFFVTPKHTSTFVRDFTCGNKKGLFIATEVFSIIGIFFAFCNATNAVLMFMGWASNRLAGVFFSIFTFLILTVQFVLEVVVFYKSFCGEESYEKRQYNLGQGFSLMTSGWVLQFFSIISSIIVYRKTVFYFHTKPEDSDENNSNNENSEEEHREL